MNRCVKPRLRIGGCGRVTAFHGFDGPAWVKLTVCLRNGARALRAPLPSQPEPTRAEVLRFPGAPAAPAQPLPQSWRTFLRRIFRRREAARP